MRTTAKLFKSGRSQAVRLPKEFRFEGSEVLIRREGPRVVLEPAEVDRDEWLRGIEALRTEPFMPEGRAQPPLPPPQDHF